MGLGRAGALAVAAATAGALLAGCTAQEQAGLQGAWFVSDEEAIGVLTYEEDGSWSFAAGDSLDALEDIDEGTYSTEGGVLVFQTDTYCRTEDAERGTYRWAVTGDQLRLTPVDEECDGRRSTLEGATFTRVGTSPGASAPGGSASVGQRRPEDAASLLGGTL